MAPQPPSWLPALQALQQRFPNAHPYTLALQLEVETGQRISGQTAALHLKTSPAQPDQSSSGCAKP